MLSHCVGAWCLLLVLTLLALAAVNFIAHCCPQCGDEQAVVACTKFCWTAQWQNSGSNLLDVAH